MEEEVGETELLEEGVEAVAAFDGPAGLAALPILGSRSGFTPAFSEGKYVLLTSWVQACSPGYKVDVFGALAVA
jgi:hypothetical protein